MKRGEESFRTVVWQSFAARGPRIRVDFLKNNNEAGRSSVNRSISSIKIERQVLNIRHVKLRIGVTYCKEVEHRSCFFCRENYGDLPHHRAYKSSYRILAIELPFPSLQRQIYQRDASWRKKYVLPSSLASLVRDRISKIWDKMLIVHVSTPTSTKEI